MIKTKSEKKRTIRQWNSDERVRKLAREEKFRNAIRNAEKMTDKNFAEILDKDYKEWQEKKAKKGQLIQAYKEGRLRSSRLINEAKYLLKHDAVGVV